MSYLPSEIFAVYFFIRFFPSVGNHKNGRYQQKFPNGRQSNVWMHFNKNVYSNVDKRRLSQVRKFYGDYVTFHIIHRSSVWKYFACIRRAPGGFELGLHNSNSELIYMIDARFCFLDYKLQCLLKIWNKFYNL